ncbi:ribonuclease [Actinoallomurus iriomotensis]|uniref:ribonuclease n=1 Tax=Actinoallomurus iriomotensis TaxID=478107 RepID=UPI0025550B72|nr:ribonuclease [Actinoallomurus iriomotensis]
MSTPRRRLGLRSLVLVPVLATAGLLAHASHSSVAPLSTGTVCHSALPPEADDTLGLIAEGGPFPYPQDGEVFQNREGVLPQEPQGYYHEYTVKTPGSSDRGARRIVTAGSGTDYYTSDHYVTFDAIDFGC